MSSLAELNRVTQIALEQHRVDPDDDQTLRDLQRIQADRDVAWLEHQAQAS